jgi:hypothetical protein
MMAGAVLAVTGVAHAQPTSGIDAVTASSANAEMPWFQRFTSSSGLTESLGADGQNGGAVLPPAWTLNQRWGVTVDVRDARRVEQGAVGGTAPGQASVGAFYQFTPSMRVGGAVSVGASQPGAEAPATTSAQEPAAGVRIESAFRF